MEPCIVCGSEFEKTRQSMRGSCCSETCRTSFYHNRRVPHTCRVCGTISLVTKAALRHKKDPSLCGKCAADANPPPGGSGPESFRWKGGHRHWSKGRHGKDKNGLSWRVQRKLAWERDGYVCQHCGVKGRRSPDVHHIDPWMNSQSHALDNLICLCQSCHLKEEAKVHEVWSGQLTRSFKEAPKPRCVVCHNPKRRIVHEGLCHGCHVSTVLKPMVVTLHQQGMSGSAIARQMGYTPQAINLWLRCLK